MTRREIKSHLGSKQESPSLETAVLVGTLQEMKDFWWINPSSKLHIPVYRDSFCFCREKKCVSEQGECDYRRGNDVGFSLMSPPHQEWEWTTHKKSRKAVGI